MMGTATEERFTFRGSPKVPSPLSSHEPPPSVTLKKSPSETRSHSETPSTAWTKKRTRRANRAIKDNMYETRSRAYFSRLGCAFIAGLSRYPGANGPVARDRRPRVGKHVDSELKTTFRPPADRVHVEATRSDFRRFRFSCLTAITINEGQCIESSHKSLRHS
jgi:hypothetical protein